MRAICLNKFRSVATVITLTVDEYGSERNLGFIGTLFCTVILLCQESLPVLITGRMRGEPC